MKRLIKILILTLSTNLTCGQEFVRIDTIETPDKLTELISGHITRTFHTDFTGDGINDYICQLETHEKTNDVYKEIWIQSNLEIVKSIEKHLTTYDFFWLVNIDQDPEPEIISATGYSDGIDYCIINQDLKEGKDSLLFYFSPIIQDSSKKYWGYPWVISDLQIKMDNGLLKIKCSLDHEIIRDGEITKPDWQKDFPVIFFSGHSTQPEVNLGKIKGFQWMTILEITENVLIEEKK